MPAFFQSEKQERAILADNQADTLPKQVGAFIAVAKWVLYPVLTAFALLLAGLPVFTGMTTNGMGTGWAVAGTAAFLSLLEIGKYWGGKEFARFLTHGRLTRKHAHRWAFFLLVAVVAGLSFSGSVLLAVRGGHMVARHLDTGASKAAPPLIDIEAMKARHAAELASVSKQVAEAMSITNNEGIVRSSALKLATATEAARPELIAKQAAELSDAIAENARRAATTAHFQSTWGGLLAGMGGYFEAGQGFLLLLFAFYSRACYKEYLDYLKQEETVSVAATETIPAASTETVSAPTPKRRPRQATGFSISDQPAETHATTRVSAPPQPMRPSLIRSRIQQYEWKLRHGEGRPETAHARIAELKQQLIFQSQQQVSQ